MSNKIKSSLFLSCFIVALTVYNFSVTETKNVYNDSTINTNAELEQVTLTDNLQFEEVL